MKNLRIGLSCAIIILLTATACKKLNFKPAAPKKLAFDSHQLPIVANNGENYFGFLCDEKPVWGQKQNLLDGSVKAKYNVKQNWLELSFNNKLQSIYIDIKSIELKTGETYILTDNMQDPSISSANYYESTPPVDKGTGVLWSQGFSYHSHSDKPGYLKITYLNPEKHIIAGEFETSTIQRGINKSERNITKGRFDVKYQVLN